MKRQTDRALVVAGHGSHLNGDSAAPVLQHVATLRARYGALFDEIVPAFWKEEPSLAEVLGTLTSREVFVVPLFISEGYFTEQVIPRELGLSGPAPRREVVGGKLVHYCEPVGTHPRMTDVVVQRARSVVGTTPVADEETAIVIIGHGTLRNKRSAESIFAQVAALRALARYPQVEAVFMDQPPFVEEATSLVTAPDVVVVPFFIADGFHTQEEIPVDLGITIEGEPYEVPAALGARRVWYTGAVGTAPEVADVIVARVRPLLGAVPPTEVAALPEPPAVAAHAAFVAWVDAQLPGGAAFGQLAIAGEPGCYWLTHADERDLPALEIVTDPRAAEQVARTADDGNYRPLKSAPTLRHGWRLGPLDVRGLVQAVNGFYPAAIVTWHAERTGMLRPTDFRTTAERQSGIYRVVRTIGTDQARAAIAACCEASFCLKRVAWPMAPGEPLAVAEAQHGAEALICREPCNLLVSFARKVLLSERPAPTPVALTPADLESLRALLGAAAAGHVALDREGEFGAPLNRRRLRYLFNKIEGLVGSGEEEDEADEG